MLIKHFRHVNKRVADPLRPGRTSVVYELRPSGASELVYRDATGARVVAKPVQDGWFDVPSDFGIQMCKAHTPDGWYTPAEVDEEVRLGRIEDTPPERPVRRGPRPSLDAA